MKNYSIDQVSNILRKKNIEVNQDKRLVLLPKDKKEVLGNGTWGKLDFLTRMHYSIETKK